VCRRHHDTFAPDGAAYSGLSAFDNSDYALTGFVYGIGQAIREIY
jgi:hypothetical protein